MKRVYIGSSKSERTAELVHAQTLLCSPDIYDSLSRRKEETGSIRPLVKIGKNGHVQGLAMMVMNDGHGDVMVGKQENALFGDDMPQPDVYLNGMELKTGQFYPLPPGGMYDIMILDRVTGNKVNSLALYVEEIEEPEGEVVPLDDDFEEAAQERITDFFLDDEEKAALAAQKAKEAAKTAPGEPVKDIKHYESLGQVRRASGPKRRSNGTIAFEDDLQ